MSAPILGLEALVAALAPKRRHGTIVLTNGAFDLLHVGHLRYLEAAKKEGHYLVVAINSDASVRASKGPSRPIVPAPERAELVAALACVDYVTLFQERTVHAVIEALRPDVHAKGTDYTLQNVPERDLVQSLGGRTVIVGDAKEHATSLLVQQLQQQP